MSVKVYSKGSWLSTNLPQITSEISFEEVIRVMVKGKWNFSDTKCHPYAAETWNSANVLMTMSTNQHSLFLFLDTWTWCLGGWMIVQGVSFMSDVRCVSNRFGQIYDWACAYPLGMASVTKSSRYVKERNKWDRLDKGVWLSCSKRCTIIISDPVILWYGTHAVFVIHPLLMTRYKWNQDSILLCILTVSYKQEASNTK